MDYKTAIALVLTVVILAAFYMRVRTYRRRAEYLEAIQRDKLNSEASKVDGEIAQTRKEIKKLTDDFAFKKQVYDQKYHGGTDEKV